MAKRPDLSAFTTNTKPKPPAPVPAAQPKPAPVKVAAGAPAKDISTTIRLNPEAWKQAKMLGFEMGVPTNRVYQMALDDFFEKQGKPRLAVQTESD